MAGIKRPKVLVANRSEIACRVFQACRELNFQTVGVFTPQDETARHVTFADEIVSVSNYLDINEIVQAAKQSGATLIHPGYGFLSERPAFAQAVEKAGIQFVGPRAETMELMGGKIPAKKLAESLGVPTLPWEQVERGGDLKAAAKKVGFPLLLKASAGGGGKGMRKVYKMEEVEAAAESSAAEAQSAFGDGTLFLERFVEEPRHIEIQVFGDGKGKGIHLYERDCSLQRRHQKVWEEAPAIDLASKTRHGLYQAALKLVQATSYRSAGTIEFLVDAKGGFYFLEMNTRLQVEHPVTECITGVDLVRAQLLLAQNPDQEPFTSIPPQNGHAIEVRIYAEDPYQGFIPTPGKVEKLKWPTGTGIRIESGIEEGQSIGTSYDSMLAKLIVHGQDREHALSRLRFALEETIILGLKTNQSYLRSMLNHPKILKGIVHTGLLEAEMNHYQALPSESDLQLIAQIRKEGYAKSSGYTQNHNGSQSSSEVQPTSPWLHYGRTGGAQ